MKNKIVLVPDLHLQFKKPHYFAGSEFLKWLSDSKLNDESNTMIQLGDFFDKAKPETEVINLAIDFFHNKWKGYAYIIAGNNAHEYDRLTKNFAITVLESLTNITCIYDIKELTIENINLLFIPWFYDNKYMDKDNNYIKFQDYLKNDLKEFVKDKTYDLVVGHVNTTDSFLSDYSDISYINTKHLVCGHIHNRKNLDKVQSLGVCIPNSFGQDKFISQIMIIDKITKEVEYIDIPKFLVYEDVNYPNDFEIETILTINGREYYQSIITDIHCDTAIDKKSINNYYMSNGYSEHNIREIFTKDLFTKSENNSISNNTKLSITDWRDLFIDDNKVDETVKAELLRRIK